MHTACVAAVFLAAAPAAAAGNATRVIEYRPAPGQFMNLDIGLHPEAALGSPDSEGDMTDQGVVSLGGFGGYIVLGFDAPIKNDPRNPYGVDFTVNGNTVGDGLFNSSCEPAAVAVMKDANGNGIPDDGPWLELAGSDYWFPSAIHGYTVTYSNPLYTNAHAVNWTGSDGSTGAIAAVGAHTQPYYPDPFLYETTPLSELTLWGTRIMGSADRRNPNAIFSYRSPAFGYADNHTNNPAPANPRNPYFADENGPVADGFDISWAVDADGNHVELDEIDFIKIYTATNVSLGRLGESSAEVDAVTVTEPDPGYVARDYYLHYICVGQTTVALGNRASFPAMLFKNGIPCHEGTPAYSVSDPTVGTITPDGQFTPLKEGRTTIRFSALPDIPADEVEVTVTSVTGVLCTLSSRPSATATAECIVGEKLHLPMESTDNHTSVTGESLGDRYIFDSYIWHNTNPSVGEIDSYGTFTSAAPGTTVISATSVANPACYAEVKVTVKDTPAITANRAELVIDSRQPQGDWSTATLLRSTNRSTAEITDASSRLGLIPVTLRGNRVCYDCSNVQPIPGSDKIEDNLDLTVRHYGNTLTFSIPMSYTPVQSSVGSINADSNADMRYYTIDGRPLSAPPCSPGIYIIRTPSTTIKTIVR